MNERKVLCEYLGGSQLFHLNTPESDVDERGVFMNTNAAYVLGTRRFDEERKQDKDTDKVLKELSHFASLLRKSNSEALEVMFCNESEFTYLTPEFESLRELRYDVVDSKNLFNCLRGYMSGELRLATGERTGRLGGKRFAKVQELGFSPKNFVQLFRLSRLGVEFFSSGRFVVDTNDFTTQVDGYPTFRDFLMSVKTTPEKHSKEDLVEYAHYSEAQLVYAFENRATDFKFNEDKLNQKLLELYFPVLQQQMEKQK